VRQRRAPSLLPSRRRTVHFQWFLELARSGGLFFCFYGMMMTSPGHLDSQLLSAFVSKMVISGTLD
jgi:hypothetical protein